MIPIEAVSALEVLDSRGNPTVSVTVRTGSGEGTAIVDGSASIDDVNEALSLDLTTEEVDTIGGLVYEKLGRVPIVGDQVHVDQTELTVVGAHGRAGRLHELMPQEMDPVPAMMTTPGRKSVAPASAMRASVSSAMARIGSTALSA